jgi:hypothetical protein
VVVLDRPVGDIEQFARLGIHRRIPKVGIRGVVDRELPRQSQPGLRRLPAETGRDRLVRDPGAREDALFGAAALLAQHTQVPRLVQVESFGGRRHCLCSGHIRASRSSDGQAAHQGPRRKDDVAVGRDAYGRMTPEYLEALEALVQVDVGDTAVLAPELTGDKDIGKVGTRNTELRCMIPHVVDRFVAINLARRRRAHGHGR